jgi:uncharacterized protein (UPF0335 family)
MTNKPAPIGHNGGFSGEKLRQYITQLEHLEIEKRQLADHRKDIISTAKAEGFDPKIISAVLKLRKLDAAKRDEIQDLIDIYMHAVEK